MMSNEKPDGKLYLLHVKDTYKIIYPSNESAFISERAFSYAIQAASHYIQICAACELAAFIAP